MANPTWRPLTPVRRCVHCSTTLPMLRLDPFAEGYNENSRGKTWDGCGITPQSRKMDSYGIPNFRTTSQLASPKGLSYSPCGGSALGLKLQLSFYYFRFCIRPMICSATTPIAVAPPVTAHSIHCANGNSICCHLPPPD